jgi:hypothetical protein
MLGLQRCWPSDACWISWTGLLCIARKKFFVLTTCVFVQLGDGSTTNRDTPVGVVGFGSGVATIAVGGVRFVVIA